MDIQHIQQLQNGDKSALYSLYTKYSGALYGVIIRICNDEGKAQDILQETFVKIWQQIDTYDPEKGRFYTWAYRIARNTTLNVVRKKDRLIQTEDLSVYKCDTEEDFKPDYSELNGMLKKLEGHHQEAIELVYFKGLTHREAHEEMGVPLGTFKSYVRQAIKQLREGYQSEILIILACIELMSNG